jgi:putative addiction module component (TIGR02574 family)
MQLDELQREAERLTPEEQRKLIGFLLALGDGCDADAETAWDAELARRAEEIKSGNATGEPAEKVFSELRAKHS